VEPLTSIALPQSGDAVGLETYHLMPVTEGHLFPSGANPAKGVCSTHTASPPVSVRARFALCDRLRQARPAWGRSQGAACSLQRRTRTGPPASTLDPAHVVTAILDNQDDGELTLGQALMILGVLAGTVAVMLLAAAYLG